MKKYLVLYKAPVSAREQMASATPEQAKAGMDQWMAWAGKAGSAVVDLGMPLAAVGSADGTIAGYSILQAEGQEALSQLLEDHPHLQMPGGSIETFEFLSMPGM